jgi:5-methylcytosine-specific restriction endonuclease McrA
VCSRQCGELLRKLAGNEAKPGYLRAYICERDRWLCGICKKAVSRERQHPDPLCASLDHIIPVSKGGTSDPANLRLTHLRCNLVRRNRGSWEQPMLIG